MRRFFPFWLLGSIVGLSVTVAALADSIAVDPVLEESPRAELEADTTELIVAAGRILQSSCLECHRSDNAEGQLILETRQSAMRGGHTGLPLLDGGRDSEFVRRLVSDDPGYRMPKESPPLPPEQIETLRRWVEAGAPWPSLPRRQSIDDPEDAPVSDALAWTRWWNDGLDRAMRLHGQVSFLAIPFLLYLAGVLLLERTRRHVRSSEFLTAGQPPTRWQRLAQQASTSQYLTGVLTFVMVAMTVVFVDEYRALQSKNQSLTRSAASSDSVVQAERNSGLDEQVQRRRPKHPPQLSGTYYRGNDERSDRLFNGGFYCTALIRLALLGDDDSPMTWGDAVGNRTRIALEIEKAPFATPALFTEEAMTSYCLMREIPSEAKRVEERVHLSASVPDKVWRAELPLSEISTGASGEFEGTISVEAGGSPHYAIRYELSLVDGVLQPNSEVWMSAILLAGVTEIPPRDSISLSEWFDFRPIPLIVGGNSTDPALLGIYEHRKNYDDEVTDSDTD